MSTTPPARESIRRILVMRFSALGDVAVASAVLHDLHGAFPNASIDFNTTPPCEALFEDDPRLHRVISIALRARGKQLAGLARWLAAVRAGRYDLIVDLQSNDRSRLMLTTLYAAATRVRWRLGLRPGWPYNLAPASGPHSNAYRRQAHALRALGIEHPTLHPALHVTAITRARVAELQARNGLEPGSYGLFLPGSQAAGYLKRWGARNYIALSRMLLDQGWVDRLAVAGSGEDSGECADIAGDGRVVNLCGQTQLADIAALAGDAAFIVANDTGPAHLAAAGGKPLILICGPTAPKRICPGGDLTRALQAGIHCASCYRKTCSHHACMMLVSPMQVLDTLQPMLACPPS